MIRCGSVGIGRRARLRILCEQSRVGSSPIFRREIKKRFGSKEPDLFFGFLRKPQTHVGFPKGTRRTACAVASPIFLLRKPRTHMGFPKGTRRAACAVASPIFLRKPQTRSVVLQAQKSLISLCLCMRSTLACVEVRRENSPPDCFLNPPHPIFRRYSKMVVFKEPCMMNFFLALADNTW